MTAMQPPLAAHVESSAPAKRPPLSDRANVLGATVDRLDEALRHLMDRLEPILLPPNTSPSDTGTNLHGDPESWLAGFLDHMTAKVDELGTVIHRLTSRVDL